MRSCDDQRNISWADALHPHKKARKHDNGARVELSGKAAIAKSHGIDTPWNDIFDKGRIISSTGGDGKVYQGTTLKGNKPAALKFVYAGGGDKNAIEKAMARGHHITHLRSPEHRSVAGHIICA